MVRPPRESMDAIMVVIAHAIWVGYQMGAGQAYNEVITQEQCWSQVDGFKNWLEHPDITPEENHENWMRYKLEHGWVYGEKKSEKYKTHPDLVPFDELPEVEQRKDEMDLYGRRIALNVAAFCEDRDRFEDALRQIVTADWRMAEAIARKALRMPKDLNDYGLRYVYTRYSKMRHLTDGHGYTLCGYKEVPRDQLEYKTVRARLCRRCAYILNNKTEPI